MICATNPAKSKRFSRALKQESLSNFDMFLTVFDMQSVSMSLLIKSHDKAVL